MAGETLHEQREILGPEILDRHRAISTFMEELEAVDWYDQRIKASSDPELQAVLAHNRDEEKEHAACRWSGCGGTMPEFDAHLRTYLFSQGPIREVKEGSGASAPGDIRQPVGIGSLQGLSDEPPASRTGADHRGRLGWRSRRRRGGR